MSVTVKTNSNSKTLAETNIINTIYPIGSVYFTIDNNNPGNFLGGTWEQFGQGRTIVGEGISTADDNALSQDFTAGDTGGEYYHTLTTNEMPSHSHSISISGTTGANNRGHTHSYTHATSVQGHTLTDSEIPKHAHTTAIGLASEEAKGYGLLYGNQCGFANRGVVSGRAISTTTVGGGGSHSHGLNTSSTTSGGESQNHTHTFSYTGNTGNTGASVNSHNNMQPYIVIYFWRRTA